MKKISVLLTALIISANAFADETTSIMSSLSLAAVETVAAPTWSKEKSDATTEQPIAIDLKDKTQLLNDKINAQLEKSLEEKLNRDLKF